MKPQHRLDRETALSARPQKRTEAKSVEEKDGAIRITLEFRCSRIQRWLGAPMHFERTFLLDARGREVYEACNGLSSVDTIIDTIAERHAICRTDAEKAVTTYLRTLLSKGLIIMMIDDMTRA